MLSHREQLRTIAETHRLTDEGITRAIKSAAAIAAIRPDGRLQKRADGGGLRLDVTPSGAKVWRYKYRLAGREGLFTLGAFPDIGLAEARAMHRAARWIVAQGAHPLQWLDREAETLRRQDEAAAHNTLGKVLDRWLAVADATTRASTADHRRAQLAREIPALLRSQPVAEIRRRDLMALLEPLDLQKPVVAKQVRLYLQQAFDYALDHELVEGNPVPSASKLRNGAARKPTPRKALPLAEMGRLLRTLRDTPKTSPATKAALRFVLLTWCRTNEVLQAQWSEIDEGRGVWVVPASRMKAGVAHEVPLSRQALELLAVLKEQAPAGAMIFPNQRDARRGMSRTVLTEWLRRHGFGSAADVHGFRAVGSTWANESGRYAPDVIERALAHSEKDKTRAAYNRATYAGPHRALLQDWADLLDSLEAAENVVPLVRAA